MKDMMTYVLLILFLCGAVLVSEKHRDSRATEVTIEWRLEGTEEQEINLSDLYE